MTTPPGPPVSDDGPVERTYLAAERTSGAWLRTALTMLGLAVARFIYERKPSVKAFAISLLLVLRATVALAFAFALPG